jgi:hypothetical protein
LSADRGKLKIELSDFFVSSTYKQAGNGKDHAHLMRDIKKYVGVLTQSKIGFRIH